LALFTIVKLDSVLSPLGAKQTSWTQLSPAHILCRREMNTL